MLAFTIHAKTLHVEFYPTRTMAASKAGSEDWIITSAEELDKSKFGNGSLLVCHNEYAADATNRFADRKTAVRRTFTVLMKEAAKRFPDAAKNAEEKAKAELTIDKETGHNVVKETPEGKKAPKEGKQAKPAKAKEGKTSKAKEEKPAKTKDGGRKGTRNQLLTPISERNPYREGTQSHETFATILRYPSRTHQWYIEKGGRANTINDAIRQGHVTISEAK